MLNKFVKFYRSQDRVVFFSVVFSVVIVVLITAAILFSLNHLPKKVPLFYSQPWGESQLINRNQLILLPALIVLVGLVNILISMSLHISQLPLKRMIHLATSSFSVLLLVTTYKIIFIYI